MDTNLIISPILLPAEHLTAAVAWLPASTERYGFDWLFKLRDHEYLWSVCSCLSDRVSQIDPIVYSKRVNISRQNLPTIIGDAFLISQT